MVSFFFSHHAHTVAVREMLNISRISRLRIGLAAIQDLRFEEKQAALAKAREQGLDVRKIANLVSSRVGDVIDVSLLNYTCKRTFCYRMLTRFGIVAPPL